MGVNLGKAKVRHRRGLEGAQDLLARNGSGAELFQQFSGFGGCHAAALFGWSIIPFPLENGRPGVISPTGVLRIS